MLAGLAPDWRVVALATGSQSALLEQQARQLRPAVAAVGTDARLELPGGLPSRSAARTRSSGWPPATTWTSSWSGRAAS